MIVCVCHRVSDRDIQRAVASGVQVFRGAARRHLPGVIVRLLPRLRARGVRCGRHGIAGAPVAPTLPNPLPSPNYERAFAPAPSRSAPRLALVGCGGGTTTAEAPAAVALSAQAALGERIFEDASLSASGRQACATLPRREQRRTRRPTPGRAARRGARWTCKAGAVRRRSATSSFNTAFFFDADGTPTGGFFWDGRARIARRTRRREPFLNPLEMANADTADVVAKLAARRLRRRVQARLRRRHLQRRRRRLRPHRRSRSQQYQQRGPRVPTPSAASTTRSCAASATLSEQELRGLALFNRPPRATAPACHPSAQAPTARRPLFTDFTYDNLGVPRNPAARRATPTRRTSTSACARVARRPRRRAPTCAARSRCRRCATSRCARRFFHNGRFKTLKDALTFYVQRDTNPEKWYPLDGRRHGRRSSTTCRAAVPRQRQHDRGALQPPARRRAGAERRRDRRRDRVPQHADRRLHALSARTAHRKNAPMTVHRDRIARPAPCRHRSPRSRAHAQPATAQSATEAELARKLDQLAAELRRGEGRSWRSCSSSARQRRGSRGAAPAAAARPRRPRAAGAAPTAPGPRRAGDRAVTSYGELNYNRPTHDSQERRPTCAASCSASSIASTSKTKVVTELEVEHAVSSADDPGEVEVEQAYVERQLDADVGRARRASS